MRPCRPLRMPSCHQGGQGIRHHPKDHAFVSGMFASGSSFHETSPQGSLPRITSGRAVRTSTSISRPISTRPSTILISGRVLLLVNSTTLLGRSSETTPSAGLPQPTLFRTHPSRRGSPVRIGQLTLHRQSSVAILSMRATSPLVLSFTSSFAS